MLNDFSYHSNVSGLVNTTNVTDLINLEHNIKCKLHLTKVGYDKQYSIAVASSWVLILLISGALNFSAMFKVIKQRRSFHNICLINVFSADLSAGSLIFFANVLGSLKIDFCFARNAVYIGTYVFTDVSLLSIALIALKQAKTLKNLNTFLNTQQNYEWKKMALIVSIIWLYSIAVTLIQGFFFPGSRIWFIQIIFLFLFTLSFHGVSIKKLAKFALLIPVSNNAVMMRRIQVGKKAMKTILLLLMTELFTWLPLVISILLFVAKVIPPATISEVLYWSSNALYLAPLLNPLVFYWVNKIKVGTSSHKRNDVVPIGQGK